MRRNYTAVRSYLLEPENLSKTMAVINGTRSETWRNGWSTDQLEAKYKKASKEYSSTVKAINEKINRIDDERLRVILKKRYLEFKTGAEIERITGWSEKFIKSLHERALMNMEIILLEDGILSFVNPKADMMAEYEDGYCKGYSKGKSDGYKAGREDGFEDGYDQGFSRGVNGLPYDMDEDVGEDDDEGEAEDEEFEEYDEFDEYGEFDENGEYVGKNYGEYE